MKIIRNIQYLLGLTLLLSACSDYDWDFNHETTLAPFSLTTTELTRVVTNENKQNLTRLDWTPSKAEDHSAVFYTVMFSADENFDAPLYSTITDRSGIVAGLDIKDSLLNVIAEKAGIAQEATGTIYWKVRAGNGINTLSSNNVGAIRITRPLGYAYNPESVYLMGEASEAGENMGNALPLYAIERGGVKASGIFEGFVQLKPGKKYYLIEKLSDNTFRRFAIAGNKLVESKDAASTAFRDGVHHVKIDFNKATADVKTVDGVDFWDDLTYDFLGEMVKKDGSLVWEITPPAEEFAGTNYVGYKFRLRESDAAGETYEYWLGGDKEEMGLLGPSSAASDFYLSELPELDEFDIWKYVMVYDCKVLGENNTLKFALQLYPRPTHVVTVVE